MYYFLDKTDNFEFLAQICPKRKLGFEIQKTNVGIRDTMCANFQTKQTTSTFWFQICPKMDFGVGIPKI